MTSPARLGVSDGPPSARQVHCPGAQVRVTRAEYHEYQRGGIRWDKSPEDCRIPTDGGRAESRVRCRDDVLRVTVDGVDTVYGLCESCGVFENRHRDAMRELAKKAGGR